MNDHLEDLKEDLRNKEAVLSERSKKELEKEEVNHFDKKSSQKDVVYINNSLLADEKKLIETINMSLAMNLIMIKVDYSFPTSYSDISEEIFKKMGKIDEMYQRNVIPYEIAIDMIASLFVQDGVKKRFEKYVDDLLIQKLREFYEKVESIYQDLLAALNAGRITQEEFMKEYARVRVIEQNTIWTLLSRDEILRGNHQNK